MLSPSAISSAIYFEVSWIASYWEDKAMWLLSFIKEFPPIARTANLELIFQTPMPRRI
jgi:hypothetical protein